MLDHEDLKWIASTSTDLNSILQQISRYADLTRRHKAEHNYIDLLIERVELASKTAQALFDRVTSRILAETAAKTAAPVGFEPKPFTVVPPPPPPVRVLRSEVKAHAGVARNSSRPASKPEVARALSDGIPPEIKVTNPKGNREYILLVEDEIQVAEVAAEMLAAEGYKVIVANDGFEALKNSFNNNRNKKKSTLALFF